MNVLRKVLGVGRSLVRGCGVFEHKGVVVANYGGPLDQFAMRDAIEFALTGIERLDAWVLVKASEHNYKALDLPLPLCTLALESDACIYMVRLLTAIRHKDLPAVERDAAVQSASESWEKLQYGVLRR
jgi:hypothetical protein